jgi:hypothetical protein
MTNDLSRGSRPYRHASTRCVPLHHEDWWLIGLTHRASQKAPQEPTNVMRTSTTSIHPRHVVLLLVPMHANLIIK